MFLKVRWNPPPPPNTSRVNPSEDTQRLEQEPPSASAENETNAPAIVQNMEKLQTPIKPGSKSTKRNKLSENRAGKKGKV